MSEPSGVVGTAAPPQPLMKICPLLSMASLSKPVSALVGADGQKQEPEATVCQGPLCALYLPMNDAKGNLIGGGCALALFPMSVNMLSEGIHRFSQDYRIKPKS